MLHVPKTEIEPRPCVRRADRLKSVKAGDSALKPNGGEMKRTDRRKCLIGTLKTHDRDVVGVRFDESHVNRTGSAGIAPKSKQRDTAGGEFIGEVPPNLACHHQARPRPMA